MPKSMLQITSEDVDTPEKRGNITLCIIGCTSEGLVQAQLLADAGFRVICTDTDQTLLSNVARGRLPFLGRETEIRLKNHAKNGLFKTIIDLKAAVSQGDVLILSISGEIDAKKKVSYHRLENICKNVGSSLHEGALVIVTSAVGIGIMDGIIRETLENTSGFKVGVNLGLGYSPFQNLSAQPPDKQWADERLVAASDKKSLKTMRLILEPAAKNALRSLENMKTAEAALLFRVAQHAVDNAFSNELALLCEKIGVDYLQTSKIIETRFRSTSLVEDDPPETVDMLLEEAEDLNLKLRLPAISVDTNEEIANHLVNLIRDALKNCEKPLRRARISLLGITRLPNARTPPGKIAINLIKVLDAKGAKVTMYDPFLSSAELTQKGVRQGKNLTETLEDADCVVILTGHDQFKRLNLKKLKVMTKMPAAIVDFEGTVEPGKVEEEGFIYRGFGRGVWTK